MSRYLILLLLSSCLFMDPMKSARPAIKKFNQAHPNQFYQFKMDNKKVHAKWGGDQSKPLIIFVHGSPGNSEGWASYLINPKLTERFHMIAIDRLGYGQSDPQVEGSLELQARAVLGLLAFNKNTAKPILIGHSYGGPVIAKATLLASNQIKANLFLASALDPELEEVKWYQHLATYRPFRWLIPHDLEVCNDEIYVLKDELINLKSQLHSWSTAYSIIHGKRDELVPVENVSYIKSQLSSDYLIDETILPQSNHFLPWKHENEIINEITKLSQL